MHPRAESPAHRPILNKSHWAPIACLVGLTVFLCGAGISQASTDREAALRAAAQDSRLDPRIASAMVEGPEHLGSAAGLTSTARGISVLVSGAMSKESLTDLGVTVHTVAGPVMTADVPLEALPGLLEVRGVERVDASNACVPYLNVSAPEAGAPTYWGDSTSPYNPPYPGVTGRGVIIGVVDTGVDITNSEFKKTDGSTRILYLWDHSGSAPPPAGFTYGREWTSTQINAGQCTFQEIDGHGTHIAGIAAGNGSRTGGGYAAYRYVGVAPEADLIVVSAALNEARVIDGVNYVFQKAAQLGKDAVVLLAVGNQNGAHDGSHSFDRGLSALTGPGKLIVAAAGNDAQSATHASVEPAVGQTMTISFTIPHYVPRSYEQEFLFIQGWHNSNGSFRARLTSPSGFSTPWILSGATSGNVNTTDGCLRLDNANSQSTSGAKLVGVSLTENTAQYPPKEGIWTLEVTRDSGSVSGRLDAWITGWRFADTAGPVFSSHVDVTRMVASPSSADSVISVGAYTTKTEWINGYGTISFYLGNPPLWQIAAFSNRGPRRDGVYRPDVAAPGYGVMSSMSAQAIPSANFRAEDNVHCIKEGTSAAAAHVAGAVALFLQQYPDLTPTRARTLVRSRALADSYTGTVPNGTWGYGKLRLGQPGGTTDVPQTATAEPMFYPPIPNPTRGGAVFRLYLGGSSELTGPVCLRIVDVSGREIARVPGSGRSGIQDLAWDGRTFAGNPAPPGVYFGHLDLPNAHRSWKLVRIE